jgi:predicted metal-dependent enzyme (double-stranded beta helix superfamily)
MSSQAMDALARVITDSAQLKALDLAMRTFPQYRDRLPLVAERATRATLLGQRRLEMVATRWAPGSITGIHNHGSSRCWLVMMEGELTVENYARHDDGDTSKIDLSRLSETILRPGEIDQRGGPREFHRVRNAGAQCAYTLQLYSPPTFTFSIVDEETSQLHLAGFDCDMVIDLTELKEKSGVTAQGS